VETRRSVRILPLLLSIPALVFITANVLKYELGIGFLHDALRPLLEPSGVVGNVAQLAVLFLLPAVAAGMTLWRTARVRFRRTDAALEANMTIRVGWIEAAALALSLGVLGALSLYLVAENL
jgi:hypothetical protein